MPLEITSKSVEGVVDLVVTAPIKSGFIDAYENVTYETRLRLVTDALYQLRVAAREYELTKPFSDVAERIQTLLDFRIGVLDTTPQRRLFLTATFDRAWEPYIRLIWRPLGTFLDVVFCNCEGYVTAADHTFAEYADWVRANQADTTIFYNTTTLTVGDQLYLGKLERLHRVGGGPGADLALARLTADDPDALAKAVRDGAKTDPAAQQDFLTMATEALVVLYRLADYYPPDNLQGDGKYLLRAAQDLFRGWNTKCPNELPKDVKDAHAEAFAWLETTIPQSTPQIPDPTIPDPKFDRTQVQAGVLSGYDQPDVPVRHGCLLLFGVTDAVGARAFIKAHLPDVSWEGDKGPRNGGSAFVNIAITKRGLQNIGLPSSVVGRLPKEFRDGMDERAGLIGDIHVNHPRRWPLTERFQPRTTGVDPVIRPPVEPSEIDIIVSLRTAEGDWDYCDLPNDEAALEKSSHPLARTVVDKIKLARAAGLRILSLEPMRRLKAADPHDERMRDHFGFVDFVSQPAAKGDGGLPRDQVSLGELVLGYNNDGGDPPFATDDPTLDFLRNGTFLVIRKLRQNVKGLMDFVADPPGGNPAVRGEDLLAKMVGRYRDGTPLVTGGSADNNDFDFSADPEGDICPFQAHIRRANPRLSGVNPVSPSGRNMPRIMRRGMSYGPDFTDETADAARGIMFMGYNASLAEQFEVIQRWINGGNSTSVAAAQNDPLMGVPPLVGPKTFRFPLAGADEVVRVDLPPYPGAGAGTPFVGVEWGLYAFVPSRDVLTKIACSPPEIAVIGDRDHGEQIIQSLLQLPEDEARLAWKTYLEDFSTKDPAERCDTPDVWAAIRDYHGGALRIPGFVLVASDDLVGQVYQDKLRRYSVGGQHERMHRSFGEIYVGLDPGPQYDHDSAATNAILMSVTQEDGFDVARLAAEVVIAGIFLQTSVLNTNHKGANYPAEIDLRSDFITPCLELVCNVWFGLPDMLSFPGAPAPPTGRPHVAGGGWNWVSAAARMPQCPGDFLAPSRYCFYPDPTDAISAYGIVQGASLQAAAASYIAAVRPCPPGPPPARATGLLTAAMCGLIDDNDLVARNVIGIMIGALPPTDANLRSVLYEWIKEKTLWRAQQALLAHRGAGGSASLASWADEHLQPLVMAAMRKRPAPDLLWRTAVKEDRLGDLAVQPGDKVILSIVSATLEKHNELTGRPGDVFTIFGGDRWADEHPVHACPAYRMAMGTMLGVLTALFEAGRIEALPGALLAKLTAPPSPASVDYAGLVTSRFGTLAKKARSIADSWARTD